MDYAAPAGELSATLKQDRASWPVALGRAVRTTLEVWHCAREIRCDSRGIAPKDKAARLTQVCRRLGRCMGLSVRVEGRVPDGPCLIVANHLSYLDPLALGQVLGVGAVAKSEIKAWPGVGEAVANLGIVFVKRGCARSGAVALRKMMRMLEAGVPVVVFPEGTTTTGGDVLPFSRGAFGVARLLRVPVVPATLRYDSDEVPWVGDDSLLPHAIRMLRHHGVEARIAFGPGLQPTAFDSAEELAEAARRCIRSLLLP